MVYQSFDGRVGRAISDVHEEPRVATARTAASIWRLCVGATAKGAGRQIRAADGVLERAVERDAARTRIAYGLHASPTADFSRRDGRKKNLRRSVGRVECDRETGEGQLIHDPAGSVSGSPDALQRTGRFWRGHPGSESQTERNGRADRFLPHHPRDARESARRDVLPGGCAASAGGGTGRV